MCRLGVNNKVKYCFFCFVLFCFVLFFYHILWSLFILDVAKNPEFSLEVMLSQYSITNMVCSSKKQII